MADGGRKHYVFISYASPDKDVAYKVLAALERAGIPCWIAPRDVTPGPDYPIRIIRAISSSRIFVLIYSDYASESSYVPLELERAVHRKLRVFPFKITESPPPERLELLLALSHWVDALTPPLDDPIESLVAAVRDALLDLGVTPGPPIEPSTEPRREQSALARYGRRGLIPLAGLLLAFLVFALSTGLFSRSGTEPQPGPAPVDSTAIAERNKAEADTIARPVAAPIAEISKASTSPEPAAFGSLYVVSDPVPATVWLDGQRMGRTPLTLPRVAAGAHSIELTNEEYESYVGRVEVHAERTASVNATLVPQKADLTVTSVPDGAAVTLAGEARGVTPCTLRGVHVGRYDLMVEKQGYDSYVATVTVAPQIANQVHADLRLLTSTLRVRVIPSGLVYIDQDRKTEDTNATYATTLVPGTYAVMGLSLTWGRWVKQVTVDGHQDQDVIFDFSREFRVTVTSDPPTAKIYVNDVFIGKYTPSVISLRPGERKIEVRKDGYELQGEPIEITLESDPTEPIAFRLTPASGR